MLWNIRRGFSAFVQQWCPANTALPMWHMTVRLLGIIAMKEKNLLEQ